MNRKILTQGCKIKHCHLSAPLIPALQIALQPNGLNLAFLATLLSAFCIISCSSQQKLSTLRSGSLLPELNATHKHPPASVRSNFSVERDTLSFQDDRGNEIFIMKAVRDVDGEMVATDVIDAASVSARFSNVAERQGLVTLSFQIRIPSGMLDNAWQIRMIPTLVVNSDSLALDRAVITGPAYRKAQLRGYQQYERFVAKIINDTSAFIRKRELEIFLKRHLPEVYAFRNDSSFVSDSQLQSAFGVSGPEALEHYTDHLGKWMNERRKSLRAKKFRQYVKSPLLSSGVHLDTLLGNSESDFIYEYVQTIPYRPGMRKIDLFISGGIWEMDKCIHKIPRCGPVSFYVSSLFSLADNRDRYLLQILERRAEMNTACYVCFESGSSIINPSLGHNQSEIGRIKENLRSLMGFTEFVLDSVVVRASASPEGSVKANNLLAQKRSLAIAEFLSDYLDSLKQDAPALDMMPESASQTALALSPQRNASEIQTVLNSPPEVKFISLSDGENWSMLDALVSADTTLTRADLAAYDSARSILDPDLREKRLRRHKFYRHLRESLYPWLRIVKFNFHLHRRDMLKDTVETTILDTVYRRGLEVLKQGDYLRALEYLGPYADFNTALAFAGLGRNASALSILENLPSTPSVDYLMAVLYSRTGNYQESARSLHKACRAEPAFVHRANLDPEISPILALYPLQQGDSMENL